MPNFIFSFKLTQAVKLFIVVLVATAGFLGTGVEKVEAVSWALQGEQCRGTWSGGGRGEGTFIIICPTLDILYFTLNSDKSTYTPGETIVLSGSVNNPLCSNYFLTYTLSASVDGGAVNTLSNTSIYGGSTYYVSGNLTAPTTPGTYSVAVTSCSFYIDKNFCSTSNIPITVTAPPAPTATISGTTCEIPVGASDCQGTLTWNISNATNPNVYSYYEGITIYPNSASGTNVPTTLRYGGNKMMAKEGYTEIVRVYLTTTCAAGSTWDWSICAPDTPPASPAATISGTACEITAGNRRCDGSVTWDITDAVDPNVYNANGSTYSNSTNGNISNAELEYGLNTVYARDGVTQLNNVELLVTCTSGTSWNGLACDVIPPPPPAPAISIAVDRELVRSGESVTSNIEVTAAYPATCTVYGVQNAPVVFAHSGTPTTDTYSATTRTLTSSQVITVTCEASPAIPGVSDSTSEARVDVIPVMQEL